MVEAKKGIDVFLLYRLLSKDTEEEAWKMVYQTEHTYNKSRSSDTTATKDGPVSSVGEIEYELSGTSIAAKGDGNKEELSDAFDNNEVIEIWVIDKSEEGTGENKGKFKAEYVRANLSSFSASANSEDNVELELEFAVYGKAKKGYATLTEKQAEVVQYAFRDTVKVTEDEGE